MARASGVLRSRELAWAGFPAWRQGAHTFSHALAARGPARARVLRAGEARDPERDLVCPCAKCMPWEYPCLLNAEQAYLGRGQMDGIPHKFTFAGRTAPLQLPTRTRLARTVCTRRTTATRKRLGTHTHTHNMARPGNGRQSMPEESAPATTKTPMPKKTKRKGFFLFLNGQRQ